MSVSVQFLSRTCPGILRSTDSRVPEPRVLFVQLEPACCNVDGRVGPGARLYEAIDPPSQRVFECLLGRYWRGCGS